MAEETLALINSNESTIYEATFLNKNAFASIDILHKDEAGWHIFEVKSATKVKDTYIDDLAIQLYCVGKTLDIVSCNVMYIDNSYVLKGSLDPKALFQVKNVSEKVRQRVELIKKDCNTLNERIKLTHQPDIPIGPHCSSPNPCNFSKYCKQDIPYPNIFNLYRLSKKKKFENFHKGVVSYSDASHRLKLNKTQSIQVRSYIDDKAVVDKDKIDAFINRVSYPISYFDFETFNEAIPRFTGQRPFQQMPFQYSLHIEHQQDDIEHKEFLADENHDPRENVIINMLEDLPASGSIMAFNQSFEISRIKELAQQYPKYQKPLLALIPRFVDLIEPFRKLGFYHPEFHGSFSIKSILPAMFSDDSQLDYKQLDIQNGGMAMDTFASLHRLKANEDREKIRQGLLDYCKLDTLAMIKIYKKLKEITGTHYV